MELVGNPVENKNIDSLEVESNDHSTDTIDKPQNVEEVEEIKSLDEGGEQHEPEELDRRTRIPKRPIWFEDYETSFLCIDNEALNYSEAMRGKYAGKWAEAVQIELNVLKENNTWTETILPKDKTAINTGETLYECNNIDYFSKEKYSPDPNDSTLAIPYAVTKSIFYFLLASFLLCLSYCCCIMGQCMKHRRLCTFVSGVTFIVSGLIMLLGLIMYISVFKAEVGSKLRPRSQLLPPAFTYHYGFSFLLYVSGFISTQLAGISAVFLFIYRMQQEWRLKYLEDIRRGKVRTPPPSMNYMQLDHTMFYPCRRHPQAYINSNSSIHVPINFPSPVHQRRYFFSKDHIQESPCSLHRNLSQANSLKDIPSSYYDFPPPPTISYQFQEMKTFNRDTSRHFPRDITTNTVSTTADINCDDFLPEQYEDYSPSIPHEHEFVTFDLDQPVSLHAQSMLSVNSRHENNRKDFNSDTLRRTTPV